MEKRKNKLITAKKKLLTYATLSTLGISCITGCENTILNDDYYIVSDDGNISFDGTASQRILYIDILTTKEILDTAKTNLEFIELGNIGDYLTSMGMVKSEYNQEDIEKLTTNIENSSEKETAKVKTKTTE